MQDQVRAVDLNAEFLDRYPGIRILSLDCFDTIFWRRVASPVDIFYALANSEPFRELGLSAALRVSAEHAARRKKQLRSQTTEVSLEEIYAEALPGGKADRVRELVELEIATEAQHGFMFEPVLRLLRLARSRGLKVIIVSDIYYSEDQLRKLLFRVDPSLELAIDEVFCSSTHGVSKSGGIWKFVLPSLKVQPDEILHLGDNIHADLHGARRFGIRAVHLLHQSSELKAVFEDRSKAALQLFHEMGHIAPIPNYFHGQLAATPETGDPAFQLGYAVLGPILYCFADFILRELRHLTEANKVVRVGFLLRDGLLPSHACAELNGSPIGAHLNISRFAAIAASLRNEEDVLRVLETSLTAETLHHVIRQLLLPLNLRTRILASVRRERDPVQAFVKLVRQREILNTIYQESREYRRRLVAHIRKRTGVQRGETLMFVDLGYSGTAQLRLSEILKEDMDVDLIGRYLIATKVLRREDDRKGLIDESWVDSRTVLLLTKYIAAFEMLCTQSIPSTVAYHPDGDPIYSDEVIGDQQHRMVSAIQGHCLRFIGDARSIEESSLPPDHQRHLAQTAAIELCRLLYFPTKSELSCLGEFSFDFNLGTTIKMPLFDFDKCGEDMRRRGFSYMAGEGVLAERSNYPMELRHLDLSLSNLLFSANRYGFSVSPTKGSYRTEDISIITSTNEHLAERVIPAYAMHDGYFRVLAPVSEKFHTAIALGRQYRLVQIESLQIVDLEDGAADRDVSIGDEALVDGMTHCGDGVFELDRDGIIFVNMRKHSGRLPACRLVFRPIARAAKDVLPKMPDGCSANSQPVSSAAVRAVEESRGLESVRSSATEQTSA